MHRNACSEFQFCIHAKEPDERQALAKPCRLKWSILVWLSQVWRAPVWRLSLRLQQRYSSCLINQKSYRMHVFGESAIWRSFLASIQLLDNSSERSCMQKELHANKCRSKRIDVWQQAVDTEIFHPRYRSQQMRERLSNGQPDSVILAYVGRLGAGLILLNE